MEPSPPLRRPRGPATYFLLGMALATACAVLVWHFYPGFWKKPAEDRFAAALQMRHALVQEIRPPAPAPAAAPARVVDTTCGFDPLIPAQDARDGRLRMEHPFPAGPRAKAKVFLRKARSAAAEGRLRDVEVALIASCRYDAQASKAPTVPLARVLGLLGAHYRAVAEEQAAPQLREELLARAREVLTLSAATYDKALGPRARLSREAHRRLEALDHGDDLVATTDAPLPAEPAPAAAPPRPQAPKARPLPQAEATPPAKAAPRASATRPASPRPTTVASAAPAAAGAQPPLPAPVQQKDPELRQLASDLARLQAQAEAVSSDPEGMRRRAARAEARRAQCGDAACLQQWYAQRRQELLAEFRAR